MLTVRCLCVSMREQHFPELVGRRCWSSGFVGAGAAVCGVCGGSPAAAGTHGHWALFICFARRARSFLLGQEKPTWFCSVDLK